MLLYSRQGAVKHCRSRECKRPDSSGDRIHYRRIKAVGTRPTALNKSTVAELDVIAPICNSHLGTKVQTYLQSPKHFRQYFPKHDDFAIHCLQDHPSYIFLFRIINPESFCLTCLRTFGTYGTVLWVRSICYYSKEFRSLGVFLAGPLLGSLTP